MFAMAETLQYCDICKVRLSGPAPALQHYNSEKHKKKEEIANRSKCDVDFDKFGCRECNVICNTEDMLKLHKNSDKHLQNVRKVETAFPGDNCGLHIQKQHQSAGCPSLPEMTLGHQETKRSNCEVPSFSSHIASDKFPERAFPLSPCSSLQINLIEDSLGQANLKDRKTESPNQQDRTNQRIDTISSDNDPSFECATCNKRLNSFEQLLLHQESPAHIKKQKRRDETTDNTVWLTCVHCKKLLNSVKSLRSHFADAHQMSAMEIKAYFAGISGHETSPKLCLASDNNYKINGKSTINENILYTMRSSYERQFPAESKGLESSRKAIDLNVENKLQRPDSNLFNKGTVEDIKMVHCGVRLNANSQNGSSLNHVQNGAVLLNNEDLKKDDDDNVMSTNSAQKDVHVLKSAGIETFCAASKQDIISGSCGKQSCLFHCNVCFLCLNSVQQKTDHEVGSQHYKKSVGISVNCTQQCNAKFFCELCNASMNTQKDYDMHCKGQQHLINRAKKLPAPERAFTATVKSVEPDGCLKICSDLTLSQPRSYQIELYTKAMETDTICFLPTGTGKTLVSIMVISHMLRLNPRRPVVFLVDKVLLVLQQSEQIRKEIGNKLFLRWNESTGQPEERTPRIAQLCSGKQNFNDTEIWRQDIVVITAAYYYNLLDCGSLRWTDNCLVVFDEVHHCVKKHPYRRILETVQQRHSEASLHPKLLGLTASPAGRDTVDETKSMLKQLLLCFGECSKLITVDGRDELAELEKFQSNTELVVHEIVHSAQEVDLSNVLRRYIVECWWHLKQIARFQDDDELDAIFEGLRKENLADYVNFVNCNIASVLCDILDNAHELLQADKSGTVKASFLQGHLKIFCQLLINLETFGMHAAFQDLVFDMDNNYFADLKVAAELGVSSEELQKLTNTYSCIREDVSTADSISLEAVNEEETLLPVVRELVEIILDRAKAETTDGNKQLTLILVRRRNEAKRLMELLLKSKRLSDRNIKTTYVVGHGTGKDGMSVVKQEKILADIRARKYQVIVATSVAEEGIDFPLCDLVVQLNPPDTVRALVQIRGRARKKGSRFVAFCQTEGEKSNFKELQIQEEHMILAVRQLINVSDQS